MKTIIAALTILLAGSAFASEAKSINFSYSNFNAYYSCNFAQYQAQKFLTQLGARNIYTKCSGGIDQNMSTVYMTISFEQYASEGVVVTLQGRESCDFNVKLIDTILTKFDHKEVKKGSTCWNAEGSYRYDITL